MIRVLTIALVLAATGAVAHGGAYGKISAPTGLFPHSKGDPIAGLFYTAGLGMSDIGLTATGDIGFGLGRANAGSLLRGPWTWYLAATPTVEWSRDQTVPSLAATTGWVTQIRNQGVPFLTAGIAAGVEGRFADETQWGPTGKIRLGVWWITMFVQGSYFHAERDASVRLGLELIRFPDIGFAG